MIVMTDTARSEAIATYRQRRTDLLEQAMQDDAHERPVRAAAKRQAARRVSRAITDEILNEIPTGIERPLR